MEGKNSKGGEKGGKKGDLADGKIRNSKVRLCAYSRDDV